MKPWNNLGPTSYTRASVKPVLSGLSLFDSPHRRGAITTHDPPQGFSYHYERCVRDAEAPHETPDDGEKNHPSKFTFCGIHVESNVKLQMEIEPCNVSLSLEVDLPDGADGL